MQQGRLPRNKRIQKEVWSTQFTWWSWDGSWLDSEFMSSFNFSYGMSALTLNVFLPNIHGSFFLLVTLFIYRLSNTYVVLLYQMPNWANFMNWPFSHIFLFLHCSRFSPFSDQKTGLNVWTSQRNTFTELDSLRPTWITCHDMNNTSSSFYNQQCCNLSRLLMFPVWTLVWCSSWDLEKVHLSGSQFLIWKAWGINTQQAGFLWGLQVNM